MRHTSPIRNQRPASEPNLFDFVPKNVWREVYRGRWSELRAIQKAEFGVEVVFFVLFIGSIIRISHREGNVLSLVVGFGLVWVVLGGFFYVLSRYVR
jgi:uncharacterized ion transporter superfamily protein YfcC